MNRLEKARQKIKELVEEIFEGKDYGFVDCDPFDPMSCKEIKILAECITEIDYNIYGLHLKTTDEAHKLIQEMLKDIKERFFERVTLGCEEDRRLRGKLCRSLENALGIEKRGVRDGNKGSND